MSMEKNQHEKLEALILGNAERLLGDLNHFLQARNLYEITKAKGGLTSYARLLDQHENDNGLTEATQEKLNAIWEQATKLASEDVLNKLFNSELQQV